MPSLAQAAAKARTPQAHCRSDGAVLGMVNVEPVLGDIDACEDFLLMIPFQIGRGLRQQPQSIVQDGT